MKKQTIRQACLDFEQGQRYRRSMRKVREPTQAQIFRCSYLAFLVEKYGAAEVAKWDKPPITFEEWSRTKQFATHVS